MNAKRMLGLALAVCALVSLFPVSAVTADRPDSSRIYFRPGVRFGTDDRTLFIMDFLVPLYRDDKNILFFNPKFTPDDLDGFEANLGIGYRRLLFADRVILGGNVFYDNRLTGWGSRWEQVGFGVEAMAEFNKYAALTGRFNYYIPLTGDRVTGGGGGGGGTGYFFREQGIWTSGGAGGGSVEEAPEGFDGEVGYRIPVVSDYVETWVYVGGYHYHGSNIGTINGFSARLEILPTDFVRLNYEYRNDRTTHGEHHGEVAFEVPFSVENLCAGKNPFEGIGRRLTGSRGIKERMAEPVRRDVDIRVVHGGAGGGAAGDTLVEDVVFVSEDAENIAGTPDGTFEHPFASITEAMAAIDSGGAYASINTIHVINDSDSETAGGGTASLASLMIWGSGQPHPLYGVITNQVSGYPTIADELILGGGAIDVFGSIYAGTNGITVNGANANIHHNYFTGNTWGIGVAGGSAAITDNDITCDYTAGAPIAGIVVSGGSISAISRNTITAGGAVTLYGVYFSGVPSINGAVISDNTIALSYDSPGTLAAGIFFSGADTTVTGSRIMSNTITVAADGTGSVYGIGSLLSAGDLGLEVGGNAVTVSGGPVSTSGIYFRTGGSGSITADIHDNVVTVSGMGDAYGIGLSAGRSIYASITGNDLSGGISGEGITDGVYGIQLITDGHPIAETYDISGLGGGDLLISNNNLGGAGIRATGVDGYACGIDIYSRAGGLYALASNGGGITGNTIIADGSDLSGTDVASADGIIAETREDLAATITGGSVTATGRGGLGIGLVSDLRDVDAEISVPTISATGADYEVIGIYLEASNGDLGVTVTDTAITANTQDWWAYGITGTAWYDLSTSISGGSISASGIGANGIELWNYSGILDVDISVPTITATGTYTAGTGFYATGILLQSMNDAIDMTVTDTNITAIGTTNTRSRGINANGYLGITALISGGNITSTGRRAEGIYLGTTGTGSIIDADISNLTLNVTGTNTAGTGNDRYATGISLSASNGLIDANLANNDVTVSMTSSFWARGVYLTARNGIDALISGGRIATSGGSAYGIMLEAGYGDIDADISVPTIISTGLGNGMESHGIWLRTNNSGNVDADIHGITGMTVSATYGLARGISIESRGGLTGSVYGNTMTVSGMRTATSPYFYPTGIYLRAYTDVGLQNDPFLMYNNSMTVTNVNTSPQREAFGFMINYDTYRGQAYGDNVYAQIYNNTITVAGGSGSFGYGAVGGLIAARNLIGDNGSAGSPTIISGNTVTLNSNVAALGFMLYRRNAASPGNGSYVDFNNAAYGGANTITGSNGLYNTSPFSMGHQGYYSNFHWGTSGTPGNGQDYIHF